MAVVLAAVWLLLLAAYARQLHACWREPVLATSVLIIESDDWGPGPPADGARLNRVAAALAGFHDARGARPVMTLGVILAVPAGGPGAGSLGYRAQTLDDEQFAPIREAMRLGSEAGVFSLQLHGLEHYWPAALLRAAEANEDVRAFLRSRGGQPRHESLPAHLQARWIDTSQLPSSALADADVERAVADEADAFARILGTRPLVAVPVTFTWTMAVERAWSRYGIRVVVTPGTRYIGRDRRGRLIGDGSILRNGDRGAGGVVYVVRDVYFEPALGHTTEQVLPVIRERIRLGRPALLEMHRFNFTGSAGQEERSLGELQRLLRQVLAEFPALRFLSTTALAEALVARQPPLVDRRLAARVRALLLRAERLPRLRRLAWISGLAIPALAAYLLVSAALRKSAAEH